MIFPQHPHFLNVIYVTIESSSKFIFYIHSFDIHTIANHRVSFTLHCNYESQYEDRKRRLSALGQGKPMKRGKTVIRVTGITRARSRIIQNATL